MNSEQQELLHNKAFKPVEPSDSWGLLLVPIAVCLALLIYAGLVS